jgi:hypothetical protein
MEEVMLWNMARCPHRSDAEAEPLSRTPSALNAASSPDT